jgi:hypothetical protein
MVCAVWCLVSCSCLMLGTPCGLVGAPFTECSHRKPHSFLDVQPAELVFKVETNILSHPSSIIHFPQPSFLKKKKKITNLTSISSHQTHPSGQWVLVHLWGNKPNIWLFLHLHTHLSLDPTEQQTLHTPCVHLTCHLFLCLLWMKVLPLCFSLCP